MQNFNLIAQSVLKLSHCKKVLTTSTTTTPGLNYSPRRKKKPVLLPSTDCLAKASPLPCTMCVLRCTMYMLKLIYVPMECSHLGTKCGNTESTRLIKRCKTNALRYKNLWSKLEIVKTSGDVRHADLRSIDSCP